MANDRSSHYPDIGVLGEDFIAQWLQSNGWKILHRRWRCPWGEIDLIANTCDSLAFVEVKTRSAGSWDAGGLLAITPQKQAKLWKAANYFLATYPEFGDYGCSFDVALVYCEKTAPDLKYNLSLKEYIPAAF
ncbi:YraN family protein [Synechocystis sp. PCC 7509]|uniref:YraN family protein n=1 Tax=Synechocystis sp. PCC 7509 TaxID=927677 RepID=UPI0002ABFD76|nr:YraN family protein [Synechocystis sp. PCC 7509]